MADQVLRAERDRLDQLIYKARQLGLAVPRTSGALAKPPMLQTAISDLERRIKTEETRRNHSDDRSLADCKPRFPFNGTFGGFTETDK